MRGIVTVAFGNREHGDGMGTPYVDKLPRLRLAYEKYCPGVPLFAYKDGLPPGSPPHEEVPYAFKPYAVKDVRKHGVDQVIFTDASIYPVRSLDVVWEALDDVGYFFLDDSMTNGDYTNDAVLKHLCITRAEAFAIPQMSAGFFGIDLRRPLGQLFLEEWLNLATVNGFGAHPGTDPVDAPPRAKDKRVRGHRYEQSAAAAILYRLNWKLRHKWDWLTDLTPSMGLAAEAATTPLVLNYF